MNSTLEGTDVMVREIPFRPDGEVRISLASGELFLRGVDSDVVRIRSLDDRAVDETVEVVVGEAQLDIRAVSETEIRIGPITIGGQGSADIEVEVPRGATVLAKTASGDIQASGLTGETRFATASGDVKVDDISGRVRFESMSGDVGIHATDALDVDGRSVSGEVTVRAPRFRSLRLGSTSGDLDVVGELDPGGHDIQTISGDTTLTTTTGMRLETSTVTGDIRLRLQGITAAEEGRNAFRIGDGAATVRWKSMSGDLTVRNEERQAKHKTDIDIRSDVRMPPMPSVPTPPAAPQPPVAPQPPAALEPLAPAAPELEVVAEAQAAPNLYRAGGGAVPERAEARRLRTERQEAARLEILQAVERGELSVDDAAIRLAALDDAALAGGGSV
jgi:putative adhesin